jgi:DsbC/DsbD-like thiol-disulfide interchange protein/cytochrome c biogenesis protein CcdA
MFRLPFSLLALLCLAIPARAQFGLPGGAPQSVAEMTAEVKSIAPGSTFAVALKLSHPEEWHSYYQNSGGVELSPSIKWTLPEGFSAGPIQWPVPQVKDGFFGKSFIYSGSPVFLTNITAPASLVVGETVTLTADATWQICKEACINEEKSFMLQLPVAAKTEMDPLAEELFEKARAIQPLNPDGWNFSAKPDGEYILLRVKPAGALENDPVDLVPDQPFVQSASSGGSITRDGDAWLIRLKRATKDALENDIPQGDSFAGILMGAVPVAVPLTKIGTTIVMPTAATVENKQISPSLMGVLGGMFLGGVILNLMPCVFPVIGLKIMGFVQQAGKDRRKVVMHGIAFALGVFASFAILSGVLFALKKSWGYQLQDPWMVLGLMLLMFVMGLSMFGVFEIGASATSVGASLQAKQGIAGSLFSGVLATVVATPCSAPFLGPALGAAISLPALQFFTAFGTMALGLSLPYLVLSLFPRFTDKLPRPGPWMESFKQAMSFLLFGSAGYLFWVYANQIEADLILGPIFGLTCIAIACWIHGRWNLPHRSATARRVAVILAVLFAAGGVFLAKPPSEKPVDTKEAALAKIDWQPWSLEKQEALLKEGKAVYIDFTAKWCATCQVNKQRAYTGEVIKLMQAKGVVALKADKTRDNPAIDWQIRKYGRAAIPVNVLLAPGKDPVILPELLSPDDVIGALEGL